ncbi:MAG: helix-turn-helix domain-containing protein [Kibdelosporangium sp.]
MGLPRPRAAGADVRNPGSAVLGDVLRASRVRQGMTQVELSARAGVSARTIRDLELGKIEHPRRHTLRLLTYALRMDPRESARLEAASTRGKSRPGARPLDLTVCAPPSPMQPLVGRDHVVDMLTGSSHRWVSLVGIAGVGKTHLAKDVACLAHDRDGEQVYWTAVHRSRNGEETGNPCEGALGDVLAGNREHLDRFCTAVGNRAMLVVIDDYRADRVAEASLALMLCRCPRLRILTTTRVPHRHHGAHQVLLAPLPVPEPVDDGQAHRLGGSPAMQLLVSNIRLHRPDFTATPQQLTTVAQVCRALDGIPAALIAAAPWLHLYPGDRLLAMAAEDPFQLTRSLTEPTGDAVRDSLLATVRRLPDREIDLLRAMSGRPDGSWSVADAAAGARLSDPDAAAMVHRLLQFGLVRPVTAHGADSGVFRVLNLVRHALPVTARERAARSGPVPVSLYE